MHSNSLCLGFRGSVPIYPNGIVKHHSIPYICNNNVSYSIPYVVKQHIFVFSTMCIFNIFVEVLCYFNCT